ncbi:MAG: DUF4007 family protein [Cyanobacteria bacterium P01_E01_bin.42]
MVRYKQQDLDLGPAGVSKVIAFARHETFHPRFGWLKKGFDRAVKDERVFLAEDAPVRLGVGKNMVKSIRYWCGAFKILESDRPTEFGEKLLSEGGWDPYLEDPASLWLLHWKFIEPPCLATAWEFAFNQFRLVEFTQKDLLSQLSAYRDRVAGHIADSSLQKDVSCILRMYVEQPSKSWASEDSLDCPFTELGLIHPAGDSRHYTFRVGYKPNLPDALIVYACLYHTFRVSQSARTISVANLLYDSVSPGLVFKLTESVICNAIEKVARQFKQIGISDVAGKLQFFFQDEPKALAERILDRYYRTR